MIYTKLLTHPQKARMEMLTGHRANLAAEMEKLHAHMEALDAKIAFYRAAIVVSDKDRF